MQWLDKHSCFLTPGAPCLLDNSLYSDNSSPSFYLYSALIVNMNRIKSSFVLSSESFVVFDTTQRKKTWKQWEAESEPWIVGMVEWWLCWVMVVLSDGCVEWWLCWVMVVSSAACVEWWLCWVMVVLSDGCVKYWLCWVVVVLSGACVKCWLCWVMVVSSAACVEWWLCWVMVVSSAACVEWWLY